eukprot:3806606-Heterocapsa_arctica.AAC.1
MGPAQSGPGLSPAALAIRPVRMEEHPPALTIRPVRVGDARPSALPRLPPDRRRRPSGPWTRAT